MPEPSNLFVCLLGIGTVFIGLISLILLCKIIGLCFKIPRMGIIGIEGMAHFTNAYNIYMLLHSISAAGFPIALSILVSRNRALNNSDNIQNVFRVALALFILLGFVGMLILYFGADLYSNAICMPETANAVRAIAPALLFVCIAGAFRGYFQGFEIMAPTAISQLSNAPKIILRKLLTLQSLCASISGRPRLEKYPRGRRGSPAKGVVRVERSMGSNPIFSAKDADKIYRRLLFYFEYGELPKWS